MRITHTLVAAALLAAVTGANAQDYPTKPIRLILGNPAGGATDIAARTFGDKLRALHNQPVVVENRTGAATLIAVQAVAQAAPDGYTLLYITGGTVSGPALQKSWNVDVVKELVPISQLVKGVNIMGATPKAPFNTVDEWIDYMRANPGKLNYANISITDLVGMEMIRNTMNLKYETVRYNGQTPAQAAIIAGQADFYYTPVGSFAKSLSESGRIKLLGVIANERSPIMPNVPAFGESKYPELRELSKYSGLGGYWFGLAAPAGTAKNIITQLHQDSVKISADKDYAAKMNELGLQVVANTPEVFSQLIVNERGRFAVEAKKAGLEPQ